MVTPTGWAGAGLAACTALVAFASGNNAAFWLLAAMLALFVADALTGHANVARLTVSRRLPGDLYVGRRGHGCLVVKNSAPWAAHAIQLRDEEGEADALAPTIPARGERDCDTAWTFERRGEGRLGRLLVRSSWPFGLYERQRELDVPAEILVYPPPLGGAELHGGALPGDGAAHDRRPGDGDFAGIRPYVPGDRPRSVHWPTTARVGSPMVVARAGEATEQCVVRVDPAAPDRERELGRACGEVLKAFARGAVVGLDLPSRSYDVRAGDAWRRALLEALAREPA